MSFGAILGQILQDGLGQNPQTRNRVENVGRNLGAGGGGIESIFGQIQDALGKAGVNTAGAGQAAGGFADKARDFLQKDQVGSLSGAQVGGIGALAGALLGGGLGGAAKGGAMAMLGTLALSALRSAQAAGAAPDTSPDTSGGGIRFDPAEVRSLTGPDTEQLMLQAMISAAKADGKIDKAEMEKVVGRLGQDGVTEDEKRFVMAELDKPVDMAGLARSASTPAQAAEVYAASLLAINVDTAEEQRYLRELAGMLRLDAGTVAELHRLTGAPV
jgi:uncharacterized membrane protein YebE (DUF533 family)